MDDAFYVVLPSNTRGHRLNTASNFKIHLPISIIMEGEWEAALVELSYPNSVMHLRKNQAFKIAIRERKKRKLVRQFNSLPLKAGNFRSMDHFIEEINAAVNTPLHKNLTELNITFEHSYKWMFDAKSQKCTLPHPLQNETHYVDVRLTHSVLTIMGLIGSSGFSSLNMFKQDILVLCDCITPQIVGHKMIPLLRIVPSAGHGRFETVSKIFESPMYLPVCKSRLDYITTILTDANGDFIDFKFGNSSLALHFRKRIHSKIIKQVFYTQNKMDFYIVLPSNTPTPSDFENTLAHFKVTLSQTINLDAEYEVALAEIGYTKSWYNVPEDLPISMAMMNNKTWLPPSPVGTLPKGNYEEIGKLCDAINKIGADFAALYNSPLFKVRAPKLEYNDLSNQITKVEGSSGTKRTMFEFPDFLAAMLGLNKSRKRIRNSEIIERPNEHVDIRGGIHNIYLYCNVVKDRIVGDTFANLLRVVAIPENTAFGAHVNIDYSKRQYLRINRSNLRDFEILLLDDSGAKIPFTHGRTTVTLHFRPILKINYE